MNHVLFVVYDFPPEGSRGTKRTMKFIRYLPKNQWQPVVLTVRSPNYTFHDRTLSMELPPDLPVYRAWTLESLFCRNDHSSTEPLNGQALTSSPARRSWGHRTLLALYRGVGKFAQMPDSRILWVPFALIKGLRLIGRERCQAIYTSGPTHANHIVGAILSRLTRRPLVIDFRDAWASNPAVNRGRGALARVNCALERFCVCSAMFVISTTEGMKENFARRYPGWPNKWITITNGFDFADFPAVSNSTTVSTDSLLRIVHAGTLGGERSPKEFLKALGQLLREKPQLLPELQVVFVGQNSVFEDGSKIEDYIKEYACGAAVKIAGYVSRAESLDYIQKADVLLMIVGRVPKEGAFVYGISGKIYDYAASGKPVFTISEPGSTADMAQRLNLGPVVHPDETQQIKATLVAFCEARRNGGIASHLNMNLLKSFEFSSLTARLAKCLDVAGAARKRRLKSPAACDLTARQLSE